jgi:hypothetical protein
MFLHAYEHSVLAGFLCHRFYYHQTLIKQYLILGPYLKHLILCNLLIGPLSWSVCPWQAFPGQCNVTH